MAREIIILGSQQNADASVVVSGVFWLIAPAARVVPNPNAKSAVPSATGGPTWGITANELTAIQAGTTVEQAFTTGQIAGGSAITVQTSLQNAYAAAQAALTSLATTTHWVGASWDGTTWTLGP